ncbi:hypothetical protein D3C78_1349050 [compost metagenome]
MLPPQASQLLLFRHQHAVLAGNRAVLPAQISVVRDILLAAPIAGQPLGARQQLAGTHHILGRTGQRHGITGEQLVAVARLFQRLLRILMGRTAGQQHGGGAETPPRTHLRHAHG